MLGTRAEVQVPARVQGLELLYAYKYSVLPGSGAAGAGYQGWGAGAGGFIYTTGAGSCQTPGAGTTVYM